MSLKAVSKKPVVSISWVAVQLSSLGEREKNPTNIENLIHRCLGKTVEVFIPSVALKRQEESQTLCYMEGYIFVGHHDGIDYLRLLNIPLFKDVLHTIRGGVVVYNLIDNAVLNPVRDGMENMQHAEFKIDTPVKIIKGTFKNLLGKISQVYDASTVQIFINLKSKQMFIDFPASYVENLSKPKKS